MTANQTITIIIALLIYLVGLGFLFNAIGKDVTIDATYSEQSIPNSVTGGFASIIGIGSNTVIGNIVTGISNCPLWMSVIFITIPVALFVILVIVWLLHG